MAFLVDEGQTVYIGVDDNAKVIAVGFHLLHDALQILLQGLGVMGEVATDLLVEELIGHPQPIE